MYLTETVSQISYSSIKTNKPAPASPLSLSLLPSFGKVDNLGVASDSFLSCGCSPCLPEFCKAEVMSGEKNEFVPHISKAPKLKIIKL